MLNSLRRVPRRPAHDLPQDFAPQSRLFGRAQLALVALAVLAAGCSTVIPGPVVADASGPPYFTWQDRQPPTAAQDPFNIEVKLAAGDVIYSTVINGGLPAMNAFLPSASTLRIPLRYVALNKPLTDTESYFLFSTLLGARHVETRRYIVADRLPCRDQLTQQLKKNEGEIWNTFVDSMYAKRTEATNEEPALLQIYFSRTDMNNLLLDQVKRVIEADPSCPPLAAFLFQSDPVIIPFLSKQPRSIVSSLFQYHAEGGADSPHTDYLQLGKASRDSAARLELTSVDAAKLSGIERSWSLADWEASGICSRDGNRSTNMKKLPNYKIARIWLHSDAVLLSHSLRVSDDTQADFQVALANEDGRMVRRLNGSRRSLFSSLGRSSLQSLTMADVSAIRWEDEGGNRVWIPQCKGR